MLVMCWKKVQLTSGLDTREEVYQILRDFGIDHIVKFSKDGGNLSHPVRTVVEKEKSITL